MQPPVQHKAKTVLPDGVRSAIECVGVRLCKAGARGKPKETNVVKESLDEDTLAFEGYAVRHLRYSSTVNSEPML